MCVMACIVPSTAGAWGGRGELRDLGRLGEQTEMPAGWRQVDVDVGIVPAVRNARILFRFLCPFPATRWSVSARGVCQVASFPPRLPLYPGGLQTNPQRGRDGREVWAATAIGSPRRRPSRPPYHVLYVRRDATPIAGPGPPQFSLAMHVLHAYAHRWVRSDAMGRQAIVNARLGVRSATKTNVRRGAYPPGRGGGFAVFGAGPGGSLAQLGRACGIGDGVETWVGAGGCRRLRQLRRLRGLVHVHCAAGVSFPLWVFCLYLSVTVVMARNGGSGWCCTGSTSCHIVSRPFVLPKAS
jgi:hypothetical protein